MSSFKSDLSQEQILSTYLDKLYAQKNLTFERISDLDRQHQGIDVVMTVNSQEYVIDEKAQLHYINSDLPTFTFELSYLKKSVLKEGWLFDPKKQTDYYFLITSIFLKNNKTALESDNDIETLKITSVNRKKLIQHLSVLGLNKRRLFDYDSDFRKKKSFSKNVISELKPSLEGLIYFTQHLPEKPMNLQLRLNYLIEKGVAKKFHYV